MEEIPLDDNNHVSSPPPPPPPSIHLKPAHLPLLSLNAFETMKMLQAAYESETPQITMEAFLMHYSVSIAQLQELITCVLWQVNARRDKTHPLSMLDAMIQETTSSLRWMRPEIVKAQFILYATTLPHIWVKKQDEMIVHLSQSYTPICYKAPNRKVPFVWLSPNEFGLPQVIHSHQPIPFGVSLSRIEHRGKMLPLEITFFQDDSFSPPLVKLEMEVELDDKEGFALTKVHRKEGVQDFMLIMTRGTRYLRCILIQPASGSWILYPVCVHKV